MGNKLCLVSQAVVFSIKLISSIVLQTGGFSPLIILNATIFKIKYQDKNGIRIIYNSHFKRKLKIREFAKKNAYFPFPQQEKLF